MGRMETKKTYLKLLILHFAGFFYYIIDVLNFLFYLYQKNTKIQMKEDKDTQFSTNSEVKRSDDFQLGVEIKEETITLAKELLESITEAEFEKLGFEKSDKIAGFYGTGKSYGSGTDQNKFGIRVAGKTNASLEKQTMLGTKRVQSDISFQFNGKMVNVEYKTLEAGFFRGVDIKHIPYTFIETISCDGSKKSDLEKQMKELFKKGAEKEVAYLTNTRLGVDDKLDKGTASTVNENKIPMKKLTLKSLFSDEDITDSLNYIKESDSKDDIKKSKKLNTIPLDKTKPFGKKDGKAPKNKFLLFDKKEKDVDKESLKKEDAGAGAGVTASGPAGAGAGAYLTPNAFKATPYSQYKGKKKPAVTKEYNVVKENDGFWQTVNMDALQGTHPIGMPGVKPNSKEEWNATVNGDKNKLKRLGLKEGAEPSKIVSTKKLDLTKKKIFSEAENAILGVNKRYLVTEKTSDEYLKDRWKKLTNFRTFESINEGLEMEMQEEELTGIIAECDCKKNILPADNEFEAVSPVDESEEYVNTIEETITVKKPGSIFGIEYMFYKKDFLNESKKYILDLNSKVFVPNPNI